MEPLVGGVSDGFHFLEVGLVELHPGGVVAMAVVLRIVKLEEGVVRVDHRYT